MERAHRHGHLLEFISPSQIPRMDRSGCFREGLGASVETIRQIRRHRLELAVHGWRDVEGAVGRGKKADPIPPTVPNPERSEACSLSRRVFPWGSPLTARTSLTSSSRVTRSPASRSSGLARHALAHKACASTKATITAKSRRY